MTVSNPITECPSGRDPCTRCDGSGHFASDRTHHGVPGLCLDCDGDGRGDTQRRNRAAIRARTEQAERRARRQAESMAPVQALRDRAGTTRAIPREHREHFALEAVFSTADFARATGQSIEAAFRALALGQPAVQVAFDQDGQAVGWRREF